MDYHDKVVLITGAATGIGRETARRLGAAGARVFIADLSAEGAEAAARSVPGGRAVGVGCDVTRQNDVDALREQVLAGAARLDLIINNAARPPLSGPFLTVGLAQWAEALDVNVLGYVRIIQAFLPTLLAQRSGRIVNTASALALLPDPPTRFMGPYIASKGAQLALSYGLSHTLQDTGVAVSVFCPGLTATADLGDGKMSPLPPGSPPPSEFARGVPKRRGVPATVDHAVDVLMAGLAQGDFLICSQPGYEGDLVAFARHGMDPRTIVAEALAEAGDALPVL